MRKQQTKQPRRKEPIKKPVPPDPLWPKEIIIVNGTPWRTQDLRRVIEIARVGVKEDFVPDKVDFRNAAENNAYASNTHKYAIGREPPTYTWIVYLPMNRIKPLLLLATLDFLFGNDGVYGDNPTGGVAINPANMRREMARIRQLGKHPIKHRNRKKQVHTTKRLQQEGKIYGI